MAKLHSAKVQGSGGGGGGSSVTNLPSLTDVSDSIDIDAPDGGVMLWDDGAGQWTTTSLFRVAAGVVQFGAATDVNLYRYPSVPADLATDNTFRLFLTGRYSKFNGYGFVGYDTTLDTQHSFGFFGNAGPGAIPALVFGAGGVSATDTNLYRLAANVLKTDDAFTAALRITGSTDMVTPAMYFDLLQSYSGAVISVKSPNAAGRAIDFRSNANALVMAVSDSGVITWGAADDTNLYRAAANTLGTDDTLQLLLDGRKTLVNGYGLVNYKLTADANYAIGVFGDQGPGSSPVIVFGPGGATSWDTNLYRYAANVLATDDALRVHDLVLVENAAAGNTAYAARAAGDGDNRWIVFSDGRISWGDGTNPYDTSLSRAAADLLKLDDNFKVMGYVLSEKANYTDGAYYAAKTGDPANSWNILANGTLQWGGGLIDFDTNLYRLAADVLKTDDQFLQGTAPTNSPGTIAVAGSKGTGLGVAWDNHTHAHGSGYAGGHTDGGTPGRDGVPGRDGEDADFLQIPGAPGTPGSPGSAGAQGIPGLTIPGLPGDDADDPLVIRGPAGADGASGSGTTTAFTKDLGVAYRSGTFDVTGYSGLTVDRSYDIRQSGAAISSKGNARDESEMDTIVVTAYAADAATLRALWYSANGAVVVGTYAFVSVT